MATLAAAASPGFAADAPLVEDASALLEVIRADAKLPALAGVAIMDGRTVARGAVGVRKDGDPTKVTVKDQFHLGSCTKAMTAHLCALMLEQGQLKRETRLAEALPEMAATMQESYRELTLDHLLSHRSGFPNESWLKGRNFWETRRFPGTPKEQREAYVRAILQEAPDAKPGERFIYSNRNFALAGHLAERAAGKGWEELLQERVFQPLHITTAGYGAMGSPGLVEQPWQHLLQGERRVAIRPGPAADNPPAIGPGGTVHMALEDWARFVQDHLDGIKGRPAHLKPASYQYLHTPLFGGTYVGGWGVAEREWGGGRVFTHSGSNTQNFAVVWMAPERNLAVVSATNQGGTGAEKACDRAASKFIGTYLSKRGPQA